MRLAALQLSTSKDKTGNIAKMRTWINKISASNPDLVVFPEGYMFYSPGESAEDVYEKAETLQGSWVSAVSKIAKEHNIPIIVGMFEKAQDIKHAFNTTLYVDSKGELKHVYRKAHLYDAFGYKESDQFEPGNGPLETVTFKDLKFGVCVCYELRFPEVARTYALSGADLLVAPTAWVRGYLKEEHLLTLAKARSIENAMYVVISAQIGGIYTGTSAVFDLMGVSISRSSEAEAFIVSEISRERIAEVRKKMPALNHRRTDLYKVGY